MILSSSTTVDLYPFFIGQYPFPFSPGSLRPFLYSLPSSLPLLPRLPRYQVTVHLSEIADTNIAEVTRLASLLPTSSTPSFPSPPSRDLHVTGLRCRPIDMCSLSRAHPGIARRDTKSRLNPKTILLYLGSSRITIRSSDLLGNLRTFHLWLRSSDRIPSDLLRIILGSI